MNLKNASVDFLPFPVMVIPDIFEFSLYSELIATLPEANLLIAKNSLGKKLSLSTINNPTAFSKFIETNSKWSMFSKFVTSRNFIIQIVEVLKLHGIDLGIEIVRGGSSIESLRLKIDQSLGRLTAANRVVTLGSRPLSTRWEISFIPADGGFLLPHTDAPRKIVTLVVPMTEKNSWNSSWGGGTEILVPLNEEDSYNFQNRQSDFSSFKTVICHEFIPNRGLLFVKTHNSWHGVRPIDGPPNFWRRSLTINIEIPKFRIYV